MTGLLHSGAGAGNEPFCREDELADIISAIRAEDCRAVFVTSDSGLGASTILQRLGRSARDYVPVLSIHGSQSLARIPFGVLAPYLNLADTATESYRLEVLRQVLAVLDAQQAVLDGPPDGPGAPHPDPSVVLGSGDLPLLLLDDAHAIDPGTAELIVSLAMAGTVNVVASHSVRHGLPEPLPRLWATGLAENIVLNPLTQQQGHDYCEAMLGGPVFPATSWQYWFTSGGNPLFLHLLVTEGLERGSLIHQGGTWLDEYQLVPHGRGLEDAVKAVLRGLTPEGQQALNLVALAEPLAESALKGLVAPRAIRELLDWPLIARQPPSSDFLVLANPIYGQVIRDMVPVAQSRVLHERLIGDLTHDGGTKESLLRRVLWALEVGVDVGDDTLLRAAVLATKLFQSITALELAKQIKGRDFQFRAVMVRARAKYNLGDYKGAFTLMESLPADAASVQDLTFGALLRASTRSALGMPVSTLLSDAQDLREAGRRLAAAEPEQADMIGAYSQSSALMVELMGLSRAGRYAEMTELTQLLESLHGLPTAADRLNRTMALTMDAERLIAQGLPEQGSSRAAEAFALEHSEENDVFFLPENIMLRHLTALLCAGYWQAATGVMDQFGMEDGPIMFSFGGGASVVRGMAMVRAGSYEDALTVLTAGLDALRLSDPQQLLGYCTALAAFCSARLGRREEAAALIDAHVDSTGMHVVLAHEQAFLAAARHTLEPDGGWLAQLMVQADAARDSESKMLELNALALALELGDEGVAGRLAAVAAEVEGPWARGIGRFAAALHAGDGAGLKEAGDLLAEAGVLGLAHAALTRSVAVLNGTGRREQAKKVRADLRKLSSTVPAIPARVDAAGELTKRERQIAGLAAQGLSDKDIAAELTLAVRTVEGHLYRAYAKLGISAREDLADSL
ncbi:DNA-binding CsgD family transcriptional regulator [Arthrobacter stackebrandtii]|uniref:DNA-binding CsgD family transcriptional regulator n=1 Tax=Arthrobacter stackebrandtii TaxID=272161 RepID=A0ABS4YRZ7_9MICC|nr:DNA-binding CsgD family transcriptional regulator [Arthrobacter stackebrandtii]